MATARTDQMVGEILRAIVRQEVEAAMQGLGAGGLPGGTQMPGAESDTGDPAVEPLPGYDPYKLVPFAEHVLREAGGGPLHTSVMKPRIYAAGFRHKKPPMKKNQLELTLNSLASPSQHPDKFERVSPQTLRLRDASM